VPSPVAKIVLLASGELNVRRKAADRHSNFTTNRLIFSTLANTWYAGQNGSQPVEKRPKWQAGWSGSYHANIHLTILNGVVNMAAGGNLSIGQRGSDKKDNIVISIISSIAPSFPLPLTPCPHEQVLLKQLSTLVILLAIFLTGIRRRRRDFLTQNPGLVQELESGHVDGHAYYVGGGNDDHDHMLRGCAGVDMGKGIESVAANRKRESLAAATCFNFLSSSTVHGRDVSREKTKCIIGGIMSVLMMNCMREEERGGRRLVL
jgi:hypothetical protein